MKLKHFDLLMCVLFACLGARLAFTGSWYMAGVAFACTLAYAALTVRSRASALR
jgi:hypothetical protein